MKALLGKELRLENGSSRVDGEQQNGKTNGLSNGSHKDEEAEDASMDVQEGEEEEAEEAVKSPAASKGKGGRKSKGNSDSKSVLCFFCVPRSQKMINHVIRGDKNGSTKSLQRA